MKKKTTSKAISPRKLQRDFFRRAGRNVELLRDMFQQMPNAGFYIKDADGRIIAINSRNLEYCNIRSADEAIGKRSCDLFASDLANLFMESDRLVIESGRPIVNLRYALSPDRSNRMSVVNIFPVRDLGGRIIGTACCYHRQGDPETNVSNTDFAIQSAVVTINQRFAERLSLHALAKSVGLSFATFLRHFTETMKMPPGRYILNTRINKACSLLDTTDRLVADIASEVGFCDQSHFIRTFRKMRGMTPSKYRRQHRAISS